MGDIQDTPTGRKGGKQPRNESPVPDVGGVIVSMDSMALAENDRYVIASSSATVDW